MTLVLTGPPAVWQESVNTLWPVIGAVVVLLDEIFPLPSAFADADVPGPLNAQLVTCDADHVSDEVLPEATREGVASNERFALIAVAVTLACVPV